MKSKTESCPDPLCVGFWPVWGSKKIKGYAAPASAVRGYEECRLKKSLEFRILKLQEPENNNSQSIFAGYMQSMLTQKKRILLLYSSQEKAEQIKKMFVSGAGKNQAVLYTSGKKPVLSYGKLFTYRESSGSGNSGFYVSRPEDFSGLSELLAGSGYGPGLRAIIDNVENPARLGIAGTESEVLYTYDLRTLGIQSIEELAALADVMIIDLSNPGDLLAEDKPDPESINCTVWDGTLRTNRECTTCKQTGEQNGQFIRKSLRNSPFPRSTVYGMEA